MKRGIHSPNLAIVEAKKYDRLKPVTVIVKPGGQANIHIYMGGTEMRDQFTDAGQGPTGAKAMGPNAQATSTGNVTQVVALTDDNLALLKEAFDQMLTLLADVAPSDPAPLEEARQNITSAKAEAETSKDKAKVSGLWNKAKIWVQNALSFGGFVGKSAEKAKEIIEQIEGVLT